MTHTDRKIVNKPISCQVCVWWAGVVSYASSGAGNLYMCFGDYYDR